MASTSTIRAIPPLALTILLVLAAFFYCGILEHADDLRAHLRVASPNSTSAPASVLFGRKGIASIAAVAAGATHPSGAVSPAPVRISIFGGHSAQHPFPLPIRDGQLAAGKPWVEQGCTTEEVLSSVVCIIKTE